MTAWQALASVVGYIALIVLAAMCMGIGDRRDRIEAAERQAPRVSDLDGASDDCPKCNGFGWVCENHAEKEAFVCGCGGAGAPCTCNPLSKQGKSTCP